MMNLQEFAQYSTMLHANGVTALDLTNLFFQLGKCKVDFPAIFVEVSLVLQLVFSLSCRWKLYDVMFLQNADAQLSIICVAPLLPPKHQFSINPDGFSQRSWKKIHQLMPIEMTKVKLSNL